MIDILQIGNILLWVLTPDVLYILLFIAGHCLEKIPMSSSSKYKHAEREEQIIACFEKAGDISLLQIQQQASYCLNFN